MSTILAIDTATEACSAALLMRDSEFERFQLAPQRHSDIILAQIDEVLIEAGIALDQLDAIAFGRGPGSFMGVRIATGVAQGLAYALDCPVIPVSTLQALAQEAHRETGKSKVLAAWDARMEAIYWGAYVLDAKGIMQPLHEDRLDSPDQISCNEKNDWVAVGNAWKVYHDRISKELKSKLTLFHETLYPHARSILKIAKAHYDKGETITALNAEPFYVRNEVARKPNR